MIKYELFKWRMISGGRSPQASKKRQEVNLVKTLAKHLNFFMRAAF